MIRNPYAEYGTILWYDIKKILYHIWALIWTYVSLELTLPAVQLSEPFIMSGINAVRSQFCDVIAKTLPESEMSAGHDVKTTGKYWLNLSFLTSQDEKKTCDNMIHSTRQPLGGQQQSANHFVQP